MLPQRDQHDVRGRPGDCHSRGTLPFAHQGSATRHQIGKWPLKYVDYLILT